MDDSYGNQIKNTNDCWQTGVFDFINVETFPLIYLLLLFSLFSV